MSNEELIKKIKEIKEISFQEKETNCFIGVIRNKEIIIKVDELFGNISYHEVFVAYDFIDDKEPKKRMIQDIYKIINNSYYPNKSLFFDNIIYVNSLDVSPKRRIAFALILSSVLLILAFILKKIYALF